MKSILFSISLVLVCSSLFGQIKEQYRDSTESSTIVVVKEDAATDQDLLDEYFDLNNMSMNDQIMITTGTDAPDIENASASLEATETISTAEVDNFVVAEKQTEQKETAKKEKEAILKPVQKRKASSRASAKGSYAVKSHREVRMAQAKKYFGGKKKKKNKRKKRKSNNSRNACFAF